MNKIGQGYYYNVYDLGNGRVLKSQTNHLARIGKLLKWRGKTLLAKIRVLFAYPSQTRYDHRTITLSVETSTLNPEMFGNPIWVNGFEYEQDKAWLLEDYFRDHTFAA